MLKKHSRKTVEDRGAFGGQRRNKSPVLMRRSILAWNQGRLGRAVTLFVVVDGEADNSLARQIRYSPWRVRKRKSKCRSGVQILRQSLQVPPNRLPVLYRTARSRRFACCFRRYLVGGCLQRCYPVRKTVIPTLRMTLPAGGPPDPAGWYVPPSVSGDPKS
jgi:hypothetical protein